LRMVNNLEENECQTMTVNMPMNLKMKVLASK
jgi:hypothetical protein